jgi:hypothetical protein
MRFRSTLLLALVLIGLGAYVYFVESKQIAEENKKEKVLAVDAADVTGVTLTYGDREIVLSKSDAGWRVTKPVDAPADEITVKNLINAIADAESKKTIDDPPQDLTKFGLAQPFVIVKLTAKDKTVPELKVGNTTAVSFSTYVQRSDQPKIYLTGSAFRTGVDKQVKDLRDKKIVEFKEDDVSRVALRGPDGEVVVAKRDGGWQLEQPAAKPADANAVRALLSTVRNLRATDFPNDAPAEADLATYGLDPPQRQLALTTADGKDVRLLVGKETDQGLYVKTGDKATTYIVGKWVAKDLAKGPNDLRDKTIVSFDPKSVTAVEVALGDGGRYVLRSADGKWSLEGSDQPVNASAAESFVGALSRLNGNQVLGEDGDLAAYGLAAPALTLTVKGKDDAVIATVLAGSRSPNPPATEYTAKRADQPTVFSLRDFQFKQLDKKPADFVAAAPSAPGPPGVPVLPEGDEAEED